MFFELLKKTRTYRRFDISKPITDTALNKIIESARYVASAGNLQRIRYVTVGKDHSPELFSHITLGGYLPKDKKPNEEVAPTAYAVLCTAADAPDINLSIDIGIAAEAIALSAADMGIGSCMVRNFDKEYFASLVADTGYSPILVIALGYPAECVSIVDAALCDDLKYYKNKDDVNVVPKLTANEMVIKRIN